MHGDLKDQTIVNNRIRYNHKVIIIRTKMIYIYMFIKNVIILLYNVIKLLIKIYHITV